MGRRHSQGMSIDDRPRHPTVHGVVHEGRTDHLHHGLLLGVVDVLSLAGAFAVVQGDENRKGAHDAVEGVGEGVLDRKRRSVLVAGEAVEASGAREAEPVGPDVAQRTGEAGGGHREQDDVGLHLAQLRVAQPELVHDAGAEVLRDDVALRDQLPRQIDGLRFLQVEAHAAVAGPAGVVREAAVRVALAAAERGQRARHVHAGVGLDLVHLGAEEGERLTHDGTGPHPIASRSGIA